MKTASTISLLSLIILIVSACGGGGSQTDSEAATDINGFLNQRGIDLFEGSVVEEQSEGVIVTSVPTDIATTNDIIEFYAKEFADAFKGDKEWVRQMKSNLGISYRKGYTGSNFGVSIVAPDDQAEAYRVELLYNRM